MTAPPGARPLAPYRDGTGQRVSGRADEWFAELYPSLRRLAGVVADADIDPDDLVQEALVRVLQRHPIDDLRNPGAYLRRAIVNGAANERRRLGRRRRALARLPTSTEAGAHADLPAYPSDLADLWLLAPLDRAVLYLSEVEGLPAAEVGEELGLSTNAVLLRASRARRRLRRRLRSELDGWRSSEDGER